MNKTSVIRNLRSALMSIAILIAIFFILKLSYLLPMRDSLLFLGGVFFSFYIPGNLLTKYFVTEKNASLPGIFYSLALGMAIMPVIYSIFRNLHIPALIFYFVIGLSLLWLMLFLRNFKLIKFPEISKEDTISLTILISFAMLLLHLSYFTDVVLLEHGFKIRTSNFTETVFPLGIINNLKDLYPPHYPYASGYSFYYYHLNMHLEIELLHRLLSLDTLKLTYFYFPLFYFTLLVTLPYFLILKLGGTRILGVFTSILLFGSDLSFIMGVFGKVPWNYPWIAIYNPSIWTILTLNGILPALCIMFLFIFYVCQYDKSRKLDILLLLSVLGYSAYGFKSSMGLHLIGAFFLAGIASFIITKDSRKGIALCVTSIITLAIMFLDFFLLRDGTGGLGQKITFDPFHSFKQSLMRVGMSELPWFYYPVLFFNYIVASFGARSLGFLSLKNGLLKDRDTPAGLFVIFITIFVTSGFFLSEVISIGDRGLDINNAMWFSTQSLFGCWLLVAYFLIQKKKDKRRFHAWVAIIVLLSLPSTIQFLSLRNRSGYWHVNSNAVDVINFLKGTLPESTVLHPINNEPSLASTFSGRSSVINTFRSFAPYCIGSESFSSRISDVESFFSTDYSLNRSRILERYHVDYVYAPRAFDPILEKEPLLYNVLRNDEYTLYKARDSIF